MLNVGVGPIDFRFHGGGYAGGGDFGASLGPMFMTETRFNLGSVYTLAVGGLVSASYDTERDAVEPVVGALLTPAAFRFGPSRQFELALFGGPTYNTQTDWVGGLGGQSFTVLFL